MTDQRDASGLLYRRNWYCDPGTGRFTQEDPIGLAGGLNLYGFGGGDPVNYVDPFGLCPYGENPDTNTADCPNDQIGDAMRSIDEHGGAAGDSVISDIAVNRLVPELFDPSQVSHCDGHQACQDGKILRIQTGLDDGTVAGHIVHEATHYVLNIPLRHEEHRAWDRSLRVMAGFPAEARGSVYGPQIAPWAGAYLQWHVKLDIQVCTHTTWC